MCRVAIGYLDEDGEREVVRREAHSEAEDLIAVAVTVARGTRTHPAVRTGASVRGAIDLVRLARGLERIRGAGLDRDGLLDAAVAALSGRIRVHEDHDRTAEEVIAELLDQALAASPEMAPG
jgi:MoxR-like ATPase